MGSGASKADRARKKLEAVQALVEPLHAAAPPPDGQRSRRRRRSPAALDLCCGNEPGGAGGTAVQQEGSFERPVSAPDDPEEAGPEPGKHTGGSTWSLGHGLQLVQAAEAAAADAEEVSPAERLQTPSTPRTKAEGLAEARREALKATERSEIGRTGAAETTAADLAADLVDANDGMVRQPGHGPLRRPVRGT
eukprot:SAG31_NODE_48_length_30945_cov_16.254263_40_plen_193_part_00